MSANFYRPQRFGGAADAGKGAELSSKVPAPPAPRELLADLIDDGAAGAGWLDVFRRGQAFDQFTDSLVEKVDGFLTPVAVEAE